MSHPVRLHRHWVNMQNGGGYRLWDGGWDRGEVQKFYPRGEHTPRWRAWDASGRPLGPVARGFASRREAGEALCPTEASS